MFLLECAMIHRPPNLCRILQSVEIIVEEHVKNKSSPSQAVVRNLTLDTLEL